MKLYSSNARPALYYYLYKGVTIYVNGLTPMGYTGPNTTYEVKGMLCMNLKSAKSAVDRINAGKGY